MKSIKFSYDKQRLTAKPSGDEVRYISNRMARSCVELKEEELKEVIYNIGTKGCTFCPATFTNGKRNKENFEQQQFIALDFDNKNPNEKISFAEVKDRADFLGLPILFAYDTLSSKEHDKYRVVFLNDVSVTDERVAEAMQLAMGAMFPEADASCYKDISKMYFGGMNLLYYDDQMPEINIESVFRNLACDMRRKYKQNHYKDYIARFAKKTGIALNKNGFLDVMSSDYLPETDNPTEDSGAPQFIKIGKNSPSVIIYEKNTNIIGNGEIFPKYYIVNFEKGTRTSSVKTPDEKSKNHKAYRSGVLQDMSKSCKLYDEFITGKRKLRHEELFGIATNLIHVETGEKLFTQIRLKYQDLYTDDKANERWKSQLSYMSKNDYCPQRCDKYCPYCDECPHGKNILSTVHPKRGGMEPIAGYHEEYVSMEEMQEDVYNAIHRAFYSGDKKFHIIKAQVGAGKSYSYLKLMTEYTDARFLIAVPTNLLKREIYEAAKKLGIRIIVTPSLEEIKDEIPDRIWKNIQRLYKKGQHYLVHRYIQKELKKEDIPCLAKYMMKREKLKEWKGCVITTHRYLLSMDKNRLDVFDAIIIDEDIVFKSVVSNQVEITVSKLKKLEKKITDPVLSQKIKELLEASQTRSYIKSDEIEWDYGNRDKNLPAFDIPAFCSAERFCLRRAEMEKDLSEDTFVFLKQADFPGEKYIIVSATANENICRQYFGEENVDFYQCKKAANKGILKQYFGKSMSRSCLADHPFMVEKLMKRFGMDENRVITFLSEDIGQLHFGNTEGSNMLEGKDILVAGTPYQPEFQYKLIAFYMGMEFDEDEKMASQTVVHNGHRFRFTTFADEDLRAVQFWMIESELEQAVGRARLLRNACTVHLFSNFPLSQSKMIRDFDYDNL